GTLPRPDRGVRHQLSRLSLHPDHHLRLGDHHPRRPAQRPARPRRSEKGMTSRAYLLAGVLVVATVLAYTSVADSYAVFLIATISLTAIACIGLNVLLGLAGQISLGHIGFMAIGAYTTVLLMEKAGWPY